MEIFENERIDDLEFHGMKLIQNKNGFCFGVDSVLISNYAKNLKKNSIVLDLGTGTGIISILLSQKTKAKKIYGIEIQEKVANMAKRSVELNGLQEKIEIVNLDLKELFSKFEKHSIDVIVTNPPYKKENTGLKNLDETQIISRHEVACNLEDIIKVSSEALKDLGEFYMVHRAERLVDIMVLLRKYKLEPKEIRFVQSYINEKPNLILVKAIRCAREFLKIDKSLIIYNEDGSYTNEILEIYEKKVK